MKKSYSVALVRMWPRPGGHLAVMRTLMASSSVNAAFALRKDMGVLEPPRGKASTWVG